MQETQVQSLIQEDPNGAKQLSLLLFSHAKHMHHNYWPCVLEPRSFKYWSPRALEPVLHNKKSHCTDKPAHHNQRKAHAATKIQHSQK